MITVKFHRDARNTGWQHTTAGSMWTPVPGGGLTPSSPAVLDGGSVRLVVRGADDRLYTITP